MRKKAQHGTSDAKNRRSVQVYRDRTWQRCAFQRLQKYDIFTLTEPDGTPVTDETGGRVFCAMSYPYLNDQGEWEIIIRSRVSVRACGKR